MTDIKKLTGCPIWSICLVWLLIMCLCVSCTSDEPPESSPAAETAPVTGTPDATEGPEGSATETVPVTEEPDTEGPVIAGVKPLAVLVGESPNYRDGVTAVDNRDGSVPLQVDSSNVNLSAAGEYEVVYFAEDSSGNRTEVTTTIVVTEPDPEPSNGGQEGAQTKVITLEDVNALTDKILAKIINDGMSQEEKARAIFDYVYKNIKYVGSSDKSSWIVGAYDGFAAGRGDCFSYFSCSKALLTRAGIPNVDVQRVGGVTRHFWQLVDVGSGYYHFDACPHDRSYPVTSFMLTDAEAEEYSSWRGYNYYNYDHESCPVTVATTPFRGTAWHAPGWTPPAEPEDPAVPEPEDPAVPEPEDPAQPEPEPGSGSAPEPAEQPEGQEG